MFIVSLSCKLLHTILLFGVWRVCSTEAELTKHLCHLVNGNKRYYKWKLKQKHSKILQIFGFVTSPNCRSWTVGGDNDWESLELKSDSKNSFFNYLHCVFRMGMNHTKKGVLLWVKMRWARTVSSIILQTKWLLQMDTTCPLPCWTRLRFWFSDEPRILPFPSSAAFTQCLWCLQLGVSYSTDYASFLTLFQTPLTLPPFPLNIW